MSNTFTNACRRLRMSPPQKAVLMCLADRARESGLCWPSAAGICEWTCFGRTAVIEAVRWLESEGLVVIEEVKGKSNRYFLQMHALSARAAEVEPSATQTGSSGEPLSQRETGSTGDEHPGLRDPDTSHASSELEASRNNNKTTNVKRTNMASALSAADRTDGPLDATRQFRRGSR